MLAALFALVVLAAGAALVWARLSRPRPPLGWTHVGEPPPGADEALDALRTLCPGMRFGGTIEWVTEPWPLPYGQGLAAGQVLDFARHRIRLLGLAWLPHEIGHLYLRSAAESEALREWTERARAAIG